jgi:phage/plasmid-associated DNA primase/5S rRNA maturation endonuclease (ribonuclease M5)/uncharacterized Zn finger protein (UPF0148 family)
MNQNIKPNLLCPSCGKKAAYQFINTGIIKCSACGYDTTEEYKEKRKLEKKQSSEAETTLELIEEYKKSTGKHHRFSDKVLQYFNINAGSHQLKSGKVRRSIILSDYNNRQFKFLSRSIKVKPIWMALQSNSWWYLPKKIKEITGPIYIVEGPWDVFSLYEALDIVSICPVNGAGSIRAEAVAELQDDFFNREIIFIFDNDKAGRSGVEKAAKIILERTRPASVSICDLSNITQVGGDIDDLVMSCNLDGLKSALNERHFISINSLEKKWPLPAIPVPFYDRKTVEEIWNSFSLQGIERDQHLVEIAFSLYSDPVLAKKEFYKLKTVYTEMLSYALNLSIKELIKKYKIVKSSNNYLMMKKNEKPWVEMEDSELYQITCEAYGIAYGINGNTIRKKTEVEHVFHILFNSSLDVEFDKIDQIFFKSKIFDVKLGQFREYSDNDYFTARLNFDPSSNKSNVLQETLSTWFESDEEIILEFKKLLWHVMSRQRHDHKFFLLLGPGGDGKGEAAKFLEALVPKTSYVPIEKLLQEKNDTFLLAVSSCDLNISDEMAVNGRVSEHTLKRLTGGAKVTIDRKFKSATTLKLHSAYVTLSNTLPAVSDNTLYFYKRLRIFEFKKTLRETENEKFNFFESVLLPALPDICFELIADSEALNEKFNKNPIMETRVRQSSPTFSYWEDFFEGETLISECTEIYISSKLAIGVNITDNYKKFRTYLKENGHSDMSSERFSRGSEEVLFSFLIKKYKDIEKKPIRVRQSKARYICFYKNEKLNQDEVRF